MSKGVFPRNLKTGYITPNHKSDEIEDVRNYRPVVIQSCLAKVFESLVLDLLTFTFKNIITPEQHGFFTGRSTSTNLAVFQNYILQSFSRSKQVDAIYLDFAKAFDCISHTHLISKLQAIGIHGSLLHWLKSYLIDRWLFVRFGGVISEGIKAISGVPQGSLLGPTLFSLFINDIGVNLSSDFLLFADDAKLFMEVSSLEDCLRLQRNLEEIVNWCHLNDMDLNSSKCYVMTYTRSKSPLLGDYSIDGKNLKRVNKVKDLGIIMVPDLNPRDHLLHISTKANSVLGFIMRASRDGLSIHALRHLYVSLVRPHLEYGSVIWSPYQRNDCELLERIQVRFLRIIGVLLGFNYRSVPVIELQRNLNLPLLQTRRRNLDLMFLFKILNYEIDCPPLLGLINFRIPRNTRSQELFGRQLLYTMYGYHGTLPRITRYGNEASLHVDFFGSSSACFKGGLTALNSF